jgi:hypothetical protein
MDRPACKPGSVPPCDGDDHLSSPAIARGIERPTRGSWRIGPILPSAWPCFRWGLPSRRIAPPLVRSYIKGRSPAPFHPCRQCGVRSAECGVKSILVFTPRSALRAPHWVGGLLSVALSRPLADRTGMRTVAGGGRYPPPRPAKPGLSSPVSGGDRPADRPIELLLYPTPRAGRRFDRRGTNRPAAVAPVPRDRHNGAYDDGIPPSERSP